MGRRLQSLDTFVEDVRVRYATSVLLNRRVDDFEWPKWLVYGPPGSGHQGITIVPSEFFGPDYGSPRTLPHLPLRALEGIPILFGEPAIEQCGAELVVRADLLASAFFLLTRYEEWVRPNVRDEHGRFPGRESVPFRAGFIERPIVDEYSAMLREWAHRVGVEVAEPRRRFSVLLTHDVDWIGPERGLFLAVRSVVGGLLGRRPLARALSDAAVSVGLLRHPCDNLEDVIRMERPLTERFPPDRCHSVYFFMAGGEPPYDGFYSLRNPKTLNCLRHVVASGASIGLHSSYAAGADPTRVLQERRMLQEITGLPIDKNRHHYLAWREPGDGVAVANAGIRWDSTLGYADVSGFRLGVCRPLPLFDPAKRCCIGIEEHPLVAMDCSFDRQNYMGLSEEAAFDNLRTLANATFAHRGEFVCLWHNTVLAATDGSYHRALYGRVLDYLTHLLEAS